MVALPLDATQVPEVEDAEPCNTSLEEIVVLESPIDKALPVAELLFQHHPGVTKLGTRRFSSPLETNVVQVSVYEWAWDEVEAYLMSLHGIDSEPE